MMTHRSEAILQEATRVLEFILKDDLSAPDKEQIAKESIEYFTRYMNLPWLPYYKSNSKGTVFVDWDDSLETFKDIYGSEIIDCLGECGSNIVGHRNPQIVSAVEAQLHRHTLHNQELLEPLRGYLARLVSMCAPGDLEHVQFCNGGEEAIESALNIARVASDNHFIISTVRPFHGTSTKNVSTSEKNTCHTSFPILQGLQYVEFGKAEAVETAIRNLIAVGETVAAMIVEPIQIAAGIVLPSERYLQQVREICDRYGVLLIIDEIQTGMGRTGTFWACEDYGVVPDILVFGSAFGGGVVPIAGILMKNQLWLEELRDNPWILGAARSGGSPLACAAAIATIKFTLENDLPNQIAQKGDYIMEKLQEIRKRHPILLDVRGKGLLLGLEFPNAKISKAVSEALLQKGVAIGRTLNNTSVNRIEPPGVISFETIDIIVSRLDEVLSTVAQDLPLNPIQPIINTSEFEDFADDQT